MRTLAAALILLATATTASGDSFRDKDGSYWTGFDIPARYLDAPYTGELRMHVLPRKEIHEVCERLTGKAAQFGCADVWPIACDVYVANDMPGKLHDHVVKHELAHCRGWPADHPMH